MDLLPKTKSEFTSKDYWEKFFQKRGHKAFEWYGEYNELSGVLHKYIKTADKILVIGCGNSRLSADLYDIGYHNITNIDISDTVITQMINQNKKKRPDMQFIKMDVTKMEFDSGSFSVVFDKGTLDALMPDSEPLTLSTVKQMFSEVDRVLRLGGRYMCVTLAQPHILECVLEHFAELGWMTRVCRVPDKQDPEVTDFHLPVFVIVLTKFKKLPDMKQIIEISNFDDKVERLNTTDELIKAVQSLQQYGIIRQQLATKSHVDDHISLDLFCSSSPTPRYTLHVVDNPKHCKYKFAIFIVPEGREMEWLFCTNDGRRSLCKKAGHQRLVVVTLHRDHQYPDGLEGVKAELSSKVMELAPPKLGDRQVPFLSVGDDINTRELCYRGNSDFSGEFIVEDVNVDGTTYRRLVFLNSPSVVQSEVKLVTTVEKNRISKKPDTEILTLNYYKAAIAGFALLQDMTSLLDSCIDVLLVGLGGGSLARYLHNHFSNMHIEVVELDPEIVNVATHWFGFNPDDRLKVTVADGLDYIATLAEQGKKRHIIILDVDSKDLSAGMTCPPEAFVQKGFLKNVDLVLDSKGVLLLNLVCRNPELKKTVLDGIKSVFPHVYMLPNTEDINEVVYALPSHREKAAEFGSQHEMPKDIRKNIKHLQDCIKFQGHKSKAKTSDLLQLTKSLDNLKML